MGTSLPNDIVESILSLLPAKPLMRFRCVAKQWCILIDKERFVKLHLNTSLERLSHIHLIVRSGNDVFDVDLADDDPVNAKVSVIRPPFSNSVTGISNSCNGLFLVLGEPLVIWNPFTREFKSLPGSGDDDISTPLGCFSKTVYGFAYHTRNDDYNVVKVVNRWDMIRSVWIPSRAHIYSLKSNLWRHTAESFTYPVKSWCGDVNGALHTLLFQYISPEVSDKTTIMAFSVESEKHYEVMLPSGISTGMGVGLALHKIVGCLSLICTSESETEIWVMSDYRSKYWMKIFSLQLHLTQALLDHVSAMKPLFNSKDGLKVMYYAGAANLFVWYEFGMDHGKCVTFKDLPSKLDYVEACVESLVLLHGEKQVQKQGRLHDDQDKKQVKKNIRNKRDDFLSYNFNLKL